VLTFDKSLLFDLQYRLDLLDNSAFVISGHAQPKRKKAKGLRGLMSQFVCPPAKTEEQITWQSIRPRHRVFAQHGVKSP
jgi:hypothetical protein